MDYQNEWKKLQEGSNYWKPKVGQHKVKALTELEPTDPFVQKRTDGTEEKNEQFKLKIFVDGTEKVWTMGRGATPASTYGQIVNLGQAKGKLKDVEFTVIVKSDGTKNDYTIVM